MIIILGTLELIGLIDHDEIKDFSKTKLENEVNILLFGEDNEDF